MALRLPRFGIVVVLFVINLLNYMDRMTIAGVLSELQLPKSSGGFGITDSQAGLLSSIFVFTYMVLSPVFGFLGDRVPRMLIMLVGVLIWSASTLLCSFAESYTQMLVFRSLVGFGEASYATIAPTLIADLYPVDQRASMLAVYFVATPVGSALGYLVAGELAYMVEWRWAFRVTPPLAVFFSLILYLFAREPQRGAMEMHSFVQPSTSARSSPATSPTTKGAYNGGATPAAQRPASGLDERHTNSTVVDVLRRGESEGADGFTPPTRIALPRRGADADVQLEGGNGAAYAPRSAMPASVIAAETDHSDDDDDDDDDDDESVEDINVERLSFTSFLSDLGSIVAIRSFTLSTLGFTAITFISGAFATWGPAYLQRVNCDAAKDAGRCKSEINALFGLIGCVTGVSGTLLGAALSQRYSARNDRADALVCAAGTLLAAPFVYMCIFLAPISPNITWAMIFFAELCIGLIWAPVTAMLLYVTQPSQRSFAAGLQTLASHLLGDALSPIFVGWFADNLYLNRDISRADSLQDALFPSALFCLLGALLFFLSAMYVSYDRRVVEVIAEKSRVVAAIAEFTALPANGATTSSAGASRPRRRGGYQQSVGSRSGERGVSSGDAPSSSSDSDGSGGGGVGGTANAGERVSETPPDFYRGSGTLGHRKTSHEKFVLD